MENRLEESGTEEEVKQAKTYARAAKEGEIMPEEAAKWMQGQRTGFKCMRSEK